SKEKLVLIVSHDRDFAEQYADRIIELKDGQIISDVSKKNLPVIAHSEGVSVVDEKLIHIKKGYRLTERDLALINEYIANASTDTLISIDGERNTEIKKAAKINDEGGKDAFLDTKVEDVKLKTYTEKDSRLIRSKLPYKNAFKIGASSLKAKPIRLAFTVFLCFIAFALFGLADTMASYNRANAMLASIEDGNISTLALYKRVGVDGYYNQLKLTGADIEKLSRDLSTTIKPVYAGGQADAYNFGFSISSLIDNTNSLESPNGTSVYNAHVSGYAEFTDAFLAENGINMVAGRLPSADDEIAIPKFIYDQFKLGGFVYVEKTQIEGGGFSITTKTLEANEVLNYDSIVGKTIQGNNMMLPPAEMSSPGPFGGYVSYDATVKIVGIYDTHFDTAGYEDFLPDAQRKDGSMFDRLSEMKLMAMRDYGFHTVFAVNEGMLDKIVEYNKNNNMFGSMLDNIGIRPQTLGGHVILDSNGTSWWLDRIYSMADVEQLGEISWIGEAKTSLAKNEILLPLVFDYEKYDSSVSEEMIEKLEQALNLTFSAQQKEELLNWTYGGLMNNAEFFVQQLVGDAPEAFAIDYLCERNGWENAQTQIEHHGFLGTVEEYIHSDVYEMMDKGNVNYEYSWKVAYEYGDNNPYDPTFRVSDVKKAIKRIVYDKAGKSDYGMYGTMKVTSADGKEEIEYTVVGYVLPTEADNLYGIFVGDEVYNRFGTIKNGDYLFALGKMPLADKAALQALVDYTAQTHDRCEYALQNEPAAILDYVGDMIDTMAEIFLYIGIGFAVFASLMMFNFITVSVSYKKREIGILRAVGSRSRDVFFIFFNESLVITLINFVLSALATGVTATVLNSIFRGYGIPVTLLSFGIRQIALLLGLGLFVAFIGSFFPVMKIAKKRPIDAIQNR
ncbi:MAG: FtsX-like permease family protein, partial [Clostridia bacterium]|nr:FtsX-like permease family protein [Clostridia bacterium]